MTIYIRNRRDFQKFLKRFEVKYDEAYQSSRTDIYTAVVRVAMDRPDLLHSKLLEVRAEESLQFVRASKLPHGNEERNTSIRKD
jgi:2-keto-3-deoxy-galactonokinase